MTSKLHAAVIFSLQIVFDFLCRTPCVACILWEGRLSDKYNTSPGYWGRIQTKNNRSKENTGLSVAHKITKLFTKTQKTSTFLNFFFTENQIILFKGIYWPAALRGVIYSSSYPFCSPRHFSRKLHRPWTKRRGKDFQGL